MVEGQIRRVVAGDPHQLIELLTDSASERSQRAFAAMPGMKKLDIAAMMSAYGD